MYEWYSKAEVCYAYLEDVSSLDDEKDYTELMNTEWAKRGWTLQELLAPEQMIFYSMNWQELGTRTTLSDILCSMTNIEEVYLQKRKALSSASVAKRLSWAAGRKTTRPEDIAYCLMGLFSVNMPMLYGEGDRAFIRLQVCVPNSLASRSQN
jgi:hypothetical protein